MTSLGGNFMPKKVRIDKDACIGCGLCNSIAAGVFDWDDDGKMKAVVNVVPAGEESAVEEAVNSCPTAAIIVE
jgi:ferredoxin